MTDTSQTKALEGLAAKIGALDLTGEEKEVLGALLERAGAASPEVEGYGVVFEVETTFRDAPEVWELRGKLAYGIGLDPKLVWTDMRP